MPRPMPRPKNCGSAKPCSAARPSATSSTSASVGTDPSGAGSRSPCSSSALSVAATLLSDFSQNRAVCGWLMLSDSGMNLGELWHGQLWRLWTPMLLHASPLHLLFNMYWIYVFGSAIEIRKGTWVLAGLVLATQLAATFGQMSGRRAELRRNLRCRVRLFGYVWMKSRYDPAAGLFLDSTTIVLMVVWLFLASRISDEPVANTAHFVGLAAGVALGYPISAAIAVRGWARLRAHALQTALFHFQILYPDRVLRLLHSPVLELAGRRRYGPTGNRARAN